ncbi:MAG: hypothetical protein NTU54_03740, partial [Candidatus Omnitrophica bacterium]|nr:hypothetical protein [Candidatus Omnitrophota bacterium]
LYRELPAQVVAGGVEVGLAEVGMSEEGVQGIGSMVSTMVSGLLSSNKFAKEYEKKDLRELEKYEALIEATLEQDKEAVNNGDRGHMLSLDKLQEYHERLQAIKVFVSLKKELNNDQRWLAVYSEHPRAEADRYVKLQAKEDQGKLLDVEKAEKAWLDTEIKPPPEQVNPVPVIGGAPAGAKVDTSNGQDAGKIKLYRSLIRDKQAEIKEAGAAGGFTTILIDSAIAGAASAGLQYISSKMPTAMHGAVFNLFATSLIKAILIKNTDLFKKTEDGDIVAASKGLSFYFTTLGGSATEAVADTLSMGRAKARLNGDGTFDLDWINKSDTGYLERLYNYTQDIDNYGMGVALMNQFVTSMHYTSVKNVTDTVTGKIQHTYLLELDRAKKGQPATVAPETASLVQLAKAADRSRLITDLPVGSTVTKYDPEWDDFIDGKVIENKDGKVAVQWDGGKTPEPFSNTTIGNVFYSAEFQGSYAGLAKLRSNYNPFRSPFSGMEKLEGQLALKAENGTLTPQEEQLFQANEKALTPYRQALKAWGAPGHRGLWIEMDHYFNAADYTNPSLQSLPAMQADRALMKQKLVSGMIGEERLVINNEIWQAKLAALGHDIAALMQDVKVNNPAKAADIEKWYVNAMKKVYDNENQRLQNGGDPSRTEGMEQALQEIDQERINRYRKSATSGVSKEYDKALKKFESEIPQQIVNAHLQSAESRAEQIMSKIYNNQLIAGHDLTGISEKYIGDWKVKPGEFAALDQLMQQLNLQMRMLDQQIRDLIRSLELGEMNDRLQAMDLERQKQESDALKALGKQYSIVKTGTEPSAKAPTGITAIEFPPATVEGAAGEGFFHPIPRGEIEPPAGQPVELPKPEIKAAGTEAPINPPAPVISEPAITPRIDIPAFRDPPPLPNVSVPASQPAPPVTTSPAPLPTALGAAGEGFFHPIPRGEADRKLFEETSAVPKAAAAPVDNVAGSKIADKLPETRIVSREQPYQKPLEVTQPFERGLADRDMGMPAFPESVPGVPATPLAKTPVQPLERGEAEGAPAFVAPTTPPPAEKPKSDFDKQLARNQEALAESERILKEGKKLSDNIGRYDVLRNELDELEKQLQDLNYVDTSNTIMPKMQELKRQMDKLVPPAPLPTAKTLSEPAITASPNNNTGSPLGAGSEGFFHPIPRGAIEPPAGQPAELPKPEIKARGTETPINPPASVSPPLAITPRIDIPAFTNPPPLTAMSNASVPASQPAPPVTPSPAPLPKPGPESYLSTNKWEDPPKLTQPAKTLSEPAITASPNNNTGSPVDAGSEGFFHPIPRGEVEGAPEKPKSDFDNQSARTQQVLAESERILKEGKELSDNIGRYDALRNQFDKLEKQLEGLNYLDPSNTIMPKMQELQRQMDKLVPASAIPTANPPSVPGNYGDAVVSLAGSAPSKQAEYNPPRRPDGLLDYDKLDKAALNNLYQAIEMSGDPAKLTPTQMDEVGSIFKFAGLDKVSDPEALKRYMVGVAEAWSKVRIEATTSQPGPDTREENLSDEMKVLKRELESSGTAQQKLKNDIDALGKDINQKIVDLQVMKDNKQVKPEEILTKSAEIEGLFGKLTTLNQQYQRNSEADAKKTNAALDSRQKTK